MWKEFNTPCTKLDFSITVIKLNENDSIMIHDVLENCPNKFQNWIKALQILQVFFSGFGHTNVLYRSSVLIIEIIYDFKFCIYTN